MASSRPQTGEAPSLPQLTFEGSPIDASRLNSPFDATELQPPVTASSPLDSSRLNSMNSQLTAPSPVDASPISPVTTSSLGVENGTLDSAQAQELTAAAADQVRTVELQRRSVLGGPPQYRLADVSAERTRQLSRQMTDPREVREITTPSNEDSLLGNTRSSSSDRKRPTIPNSWIWTFLVGSTIVIAGCFGFLVYLWAARDNTRRKIIVDNWAARATTLTATIIWIMVELQAVVAGLILLVSRTSSGPGLRSRMRNKEYASLRASGVSTATRPGSRGARSSQALVNFGFVLLVLSFALHFIATILLADFENGMFASGDRTMVPATYGLSQVKQANISKSEVDYSGINPTQFRSFADYATPVGSLQQGVDDTGESVRALLPFASAADRTSLAGYKGMATLMNSRVICMAPDLENITYASTGPSTSPSEPAQQISGAIALPQIVPAGLQVANGASTSLAISCGLQLAQVESEAPISMCAVPNEGINIATPFANNVQTVTSAYLLVNHTANSTIPVSASTGTDLQNVSITAWDTSRDGVWSVGVYAPNPIFSIQLSLCFVATGALEVKVEMSGTKDRKEPSFHSTNGQITEDTDVSDVLAQLGIGTNATEGERGIMKLEQKRPWVVLTTRSSVIDNSKVFGQADKTYGLCTHCGSYEDEGTAVGIANGLSILFQHAMAATGSPAKALQAVFTTARSSQYYARLPYFDVSEASTISRYILAYHPHHYSGLIATGALLLLHLAIVLLISFITLKNSREPVFNQLQNKFLFSSGTSRTSTPIHSRHGSRSGIEEEGMVVGGPNGPQILASDGPSGPQIRAFHPTSSERYESPER